MARDRANHIFLLVQLKGDQHRHARSRVNRRNGESERRPRDDNQLTNDRTRTRFAAVAGARCVRRTRAPLRQSACATVGDKDAVQISRANASATYGGIRRYLLSCWQCKHEGRAMHWISCDPQATAVCIENRLADGKPHSHPACFGCEEGLKQ